MVDILYQLLALVVSVVLIFPRHPRAPPSAASKEPSQMFAALSRFLERGVVCVGENEERPRK
jgi:hypothetical protein